MLSLARALPLFGGGFNSLIVLGPNCWFTVIIIRWLSSALQSDIKCH